MSSLSRTKPSPERIREARELGGFTQEAWARALGISVFYVGKLERGERSPGGPLLRRFSILSGKTLDWFYGETEAVA